MENLQNEIKEKILEYFNKQFGLPILDGQIKNRPYYTGVTIDYIYKYIIQEELSKIDLINLLKEMVINKELNSLHCGHIEDIVFESSIHKTGHWYYSEEGSERYKTHINNFIEEINLKLQSIENE